MRCMGECGWHLPIRSRNSMDRSFNWVFGGGLDFNKFGLPLEVISVWPIHNPQKSEVLILLNCVLSEVWVPYWAEHDSALNTTYFCLL